MMYDNIKVVHLELTDKCNASCPMCARNKNGGEINPYLPLTDLTLDNCKKIFPPAFIQNLDRMYMCGNYGDPIAAQSTLLIFEYFRTHNPNMMLSMHTNGSARTHHWWRDLAKILGKNGYVTFGIDGLEDTHHLYRKGTDFDKIILNAKMFIAGGGRARWDFIAFEHNEHQIDAAKALADAIGFEKFTVKKTGRFFSNTKMQVKGTRDVLDNDGNVIYTIAPPKNPELQNQSLQKERRIIENYGSMEEYLDQTPISCAVKKEQSIYVSSEGLVFPCCWTANQMYVWYKEKESGEIWDIIKSTGGTKNINAKERPIGDIIKSRAFKKIEKSWSCKSVKKGKLGICSRICGQDFNQFKDQYE